MEWNVWVWVLVRCGKKKGVANKLMTGISQRCSLLAVKEIILRVNIRMKHTKDENDWW
jgi:hypothetical protein